jgi:tRNA(Arg) A34 adenosine deaminase TadA
MQTNPFMQLALDAARSCADAEVPIGAVVIANGEVVATAHNMVETNNDPTAHAELIAIRKACAALGNSRLTDCDLYVTLEPCPMCATAISFARIRRLYFGAYDPKGGGVEHGPRIFNQDTCHHKPEVIGGISDRECGELLKEFFKSRR